jgi:hypothetical protein
MSGCPKKATSGWVAGFSLLLVVAGIVGAVAPARTALAGAPLRMASTSETRYIPLSGAGRSTVSPLSAAEKEQSRRILARDSQTMKLLRGAKYSIVTASPWYSEGAVVGAGLELQLTRPQTMTGRWSLSVGTP